MSRFLVYTSPARGHLFPIVPTLEELHSRGHDVAVRTLSAGVGVLRDLGVEAQPIDPAIERLEHDDWKSRSPIASLKRSVRTFVDRAGHEIPDLERAIGTERPDFLLVDVNTWGAVQVAEASGLPWAMFAPYSLPIPSRDAPPFGLGLPPARGWVGRIRDRLVRRLAFAPLERIVLPRLNHLRGPLGLPALGNTTRFFAGAPLVLCYTAEPFEYPRSDWPPSVQMVGPGGWDPPSADPPWLEAMEDPVILVTCSTEFQDDGKLAEVALRAFGDRDVRLVVTTAGVEPSSLPAPPNAHVERFISHGAVLNRAACVVCHGGMGITQKALALGVPVCVVPFGRDQFEVARRVEVAKAGARLPARRLRPDRLRSAVERAMQRKAGAERVALAFSAAGGAPAAADALEGLIGSALGGERGNPAGASLERRQTRYVDGREPKEAL
jgi:MGT family glycosyltransferase